MARKPKHSRPSISRVLFKDYATRLSLPDVFVQKYGKFLPESVKLRTSWGETWDVKIEETDDDEECCFFTEGWTKVVQDLKLKMFEFLVFWFNIGESTFDVSVYGVDACEREISSSKMSLMALDSHADEDFESGKGGYNAPGTDCETKSGNFEKETHPRPRFEVVLTKSRKSRLCLYKEFAEAAGLIGKRSVVLEYPPRQRYWSVVLDMRLRPSASVEIAAGWADFRTENGLAVGKTYSFEFDAAKNVIQVKEC